MAQETLSEFEARMAAEVRALIAAGASREEAEAQVMQLRNNHRMRTRQVGVEGSPQDFMGPMVTRAQQEMVPRNPLEQPLQAALLRELGPFASDPRTWPGRMQEAGAQREQTAQSEEDAAAAELAELEAAFTEEFLSGRESDEIAIGNRGARPEMPDAPRTPSADFSRVDAQMEALRGLSGDEPDLSRMEELLAQLAPTERTKQDAQDTRMSAIMAGLASAGGRINGDTPTGTALLQLGLGALGGRAEGDRENQEATERFEESQRDYARTQMGFEEFRISREDAVRQREMEVELQGLGVEESRARETAAAARQDSERQLQVQLADYEQRTQEWIDRGGQVIDIDSGVVTYTYLDENGQQILGRGSPAQIAARADAALALGGSEGAAAALAESGPGFEGAMTLIRMARAQGSLGLIFGDQLEEVRNQVREQVLPLSTLGTDGQELAAAEQIAAEDAVFATAVMNTPELRRQLLQMFTPARN